MSVIYRIFSGYEIDFGFWMFFVPMVVVFFVVFLGSLSRLLIDKSYKRWKPWLKFLMFWIICMETMAYTEGAIIRDDFDPKKCYQRLSPDGVYMAKLCYLNRGAGNNAAHVWLMVYDAETLDLIKEGDGGATLDYKIHWNQGPDGKTTGVYSDVSTSLDLELTLPPSWLDRLRAKLP
jgi:hypothetical protein